MIEPLQPGGLQLPEGAKLVRLTTYLACMVLVAFMLGAAAKGIRITIRVQPMLLALFFVAALIWVWRRHERPGGDQRLSDSALAILSLFGGGLAGGLICLVGQTFAMPLVDAQLHQVDLTLGIDTEWVIRSVVQVPGLPALLAFTYNSSFPLIFLSVLAFVWTNRRERAWELCGVFNICLLVTAVSSAIIPAAGPFHFLPIPAELRQALPPGAGVYYLHDLFALRQADQFVVDPARLQGVATFPSFHMALALMTAAAWRDVRGLRIGMTVWQGLVALSTIPIGGHYGADLVAGTACCALALMIWHAILARTPPQPEVRAAFA